MEVRDGDEAGGVDVGVGALDDHVASGVDVDARGMARVGLHEPDDDGDVVGDALEGHGDGAVCLEEVDGAAIVVGEGGRLGLEGRVGGGEGEKVLADQPLGVLRVGQRRGAPLREDGAKELLCHLRVRRRRPRMYHGVERAPIESIGLQRKRGGERWNFLGEFGRGKRRAAAAAGLVASLIRKEKRRRMRVVVG